MSGASAGILFNGSGLRKVSAGYFGISAPGLADPAPILFGAPLYLQLSAAGQKQCKPDEFDAAWVLGVSASMWALSFSVALCQCLAPPCGRAMALGASGSVRSAASGHALARALNRRPV